mmetsp:Transcript_13257/g.32400  ORF Transcript_13257/g.32400 Transcript_13257/m.32400 type:complete len:471 (+) Transcript_13257:153-1565(+)
MRVVAIDSSLLEATQARLFAAKKTFETGLILGRLSQARDHVVALVPTAEDPEGESAKGWDNLDDGWIVEHAKEVSRMMPGGISVVGMYVFCPADQAQSKASLIHAMLRKVYRYQSSINPLGEEEFEEERLLLQICSKSKRNSSKAFNCKDTSKGSHPAELKPSSGIAASFTQITCRYKFSMAVSASDEDGGDVFKTDAALRKGLDASLQTLKEAVAVIDGAIAGGEALSGAGDVGKGGKGKGKDRGAGDAAGGEREMQMYSGAGAAPTAGGAVRYEGGISAVAYVMSSESTGAAAAAIKRDIAQSLSIRASILTEDWMAQEEDDPKSCSSLWALQQRGKAAAWAVPRRVQFPLTSGLQLCAYVRDGETLSDTLQGLQQLLPTVDSVKGADADTFFVAKEEPAVVKKSASSGSRRAEQPKESKSAAAADSSGPGGSTKEGGGGAWGMYAGAAAMLGLAFAAECFFDFLPYI